MASGRAPDVVLRMQPWLLFEMAEGTSHGSPYPYDRRVPLAFLGPGVKAQSRFDAASPTDAVPTLLSLVGHSPVAGLDGRALDLH
jgi:arylsulfatase A-like enzyme